MLSSFDKNYIEDYSQWFYIMGYLSGVLGTKYKLGGVSNNVMLLLLTCSSARILIISINSHGPENSVSNIHLKCDRRRLCPCTSRRKLATLATQESNLT